ncbi:MAG: hypothetical protein H7240_08210 [Glaciimonas sp.]|nr:hypothetical protein [Glaciimonas sp.]
MQIIFVWLMMARGYFPILPPDAPHSGNYPVTTFLVVMSIIRIAAIENVMLDESGVGM